MSQKNWALPNKAFADPASDWREILMIFVANSVVSCFESANLMLLLGALQLQPWEHTGSGKGH